jgi:hypothetical protein
MPKRTDKGSDVDSAGVYFISVEEFEARSERANEKTDEAAGETAADNDPEDGRKSDKPTGR